MVRLGVRASLSIRVKKNLVISPSLGTIYIFYVDCKQKCPSPSRLNYFNKVLRVNENK